MKDKNVAAMRVFLWVAQWDSHWVALQADHWAVRKVE